MITMRRINLNQDCRFLFNLINNLTDDIIPGQINYLNADEFHHWLTGQLNGYYHDFYIFENYELENPICGFALSYDYRVYDRHCHIYFRFFIDIGPDTVQSFINHLFQEYPLVKIFFETTSSNHTKLSFAESLGFNTEMCLKEFKYQNGRYEDWNVLSIYPEYTGGAANEK